MQNISAKFMNFTRITSSILTGTAIFMLCLASRCSGQDDLARRFGDEVAKECLRVSVDLPAKNAEHSIQLHSEMRELMNEISVPEEKKDRPMVELMTAEQAAKWGQLQQRQQYLTLLDLLNRRRERDLNLITTLVRLSFQEYMWNYTPKQSDSDYPEYGFLNLLRSFGGKERYVDAAFIEDPIANSIRALMEYPVPSVLKLYAAAEPIFKKYGREGQTLAPSDIPDSKDRETFGVIRYSVQGKMTIIDSLAVIRAFYMIATIEYQTAMEDVRASGGVVDTIGMTANKYAKDRYGPEMLALLGTYRTLNEKGLKDFLKAYDTASTPQVPPSDLSQPQSPPLPKN